MERIESLLKTIKVLRSEKGCSWDRKQTHESLIPYLEEESAEVIDAIRQESSSHMREELGDLLLQILLHCEIASEEEQFDFKAVADTLNDKMIRRHPHVFAGKIYQTTEEQKADWNRIKAEEREANGENRSAHLLDNIPLSLSGLKRAAQLQKKAASVGFDWNNLEGVTAKIEEEYQELYDEIHANDRDAIEAEMGDLLFAIVNLARHLDIDPETAISRTNQKFYQRFNYVESQVEGAFEAHDLEGLDYYWDEAKARGL